MMFLMNGRDEPRVAFNYRAPGARESVLVPNDSTPFAIEPHPSAAFFANHSGCTIPLEADGFFKSANGNSSCPYFHPRSYRRFSSLKDITSPTLDRQTGVHDRSVSRAEHGQNIPLLFGYPIPN